MWSWAFILLGLIGFTIYLFINRRIGFLLFGAYLARTAAALIHYYVFTLPAGCCDAVRFEQRAWLWSDMPAEFYFALFDPTQSYVISWLGAGVYAIFGRDPLLLQMINVFLGTLTVFVVYKTSVLVMRERYAMVAAWLFALHPTIVEHSAVFLREAQIVLMLALSIYFFVRWMQEYRPVFVVGAVASLTISSLFHGAMIVGLAGMIVVIGGVLFYRALVTVQTARVRRGVLPTTMILVTGVIIVIGLQQLPRLSTIGNMEELMQAEQAAMELGRAAEVRAHGSASYLEWMTVNSPADVVWQAPIRTVYFLYSPFPWDVSALRHTKGFIDSAFLLFITFLVVKYRRTLWRHPIYRALFVILLIYVVIFSFGASNFGSAIRHKSKFMPIFVMFYGLKDAARARVGAAARPNRHAGPQYSHPGL
jgi:hypothetical protein